MIRTLHLNPVEPALLSARLAAGFDLTLDLIYRNAVDQVINYDLAANLVLEGRTTGQSQSYVVPATDLVNGKARVRVPGGDLQDKNGYRMTLVGTVQGARRVIGQGTLILGGAGIEDVVAADVIDTVDLTLGYGTPAELDVTLWQDASGSVPFDMTAEGTTISAAILTGQGGTQLVAWTLTVLAANKVRMSLTLEQVDALPTPCWWALTAATSLGITTLCQGTVTITGP